MKNDCSDHNNLLKKLVYIFFDNRAIYSKISGHTDESSDKLPTLQQGHRQSRASNHQRWGNSKILSMLESLRMVLSCLGLH